jgi:hypothetical protein
MRRKLFEEILALESPINKRFEQQLNLIQNPDKKRKVEQMLRQVSYRNIQEPASSTGKYHPDYAHGEFGLSRHVKAVISFICDICEAFEDLDRDTMIIAALMHDIVKYKGDEKYTSKNHAEEAGKWLESVGLKDEARLVRAHMGKWDAKKGKAPMPEKEDEKFLHLADYLSSQQWISVAFDENDNIKKYNDTADRVLALEREKTDPYKKGGENDLTWIDDKKNDIIFRKNKLFESILRESWTKEDEDRWLGETFDPLDGGLSDAWELGRNPDDAHSALWNYFENKYLPREFPELSDNDIEKLTTIILNSFCAGNKIGNA